MKPIKLSKSETELLLGIITGYIEIESEGRHKPVTAIQSVLSSIQSKIEEKSNYVNYNNDLIITFTSEESNVLSNVINVSLDFVSLSSYNIPLLVGSLKSIIEKINYC